MKIKLIFNFNTTFWNARGGKVQILITFWAFFCILNVSIENKYKHM